jgi:DNA-binding FadR family transcriptional regulator
MTPVRCLIVVGCCCLWSATMAAQLPGSLQAAVDAYRTALATAASTREGASVESAFGAFRVLRAAFMRNDGLGSLTAAQYAEVQALKGVIVSREEAIYVQPDVQFFGALARAHGDAVDRAFFSALRATYPQSVWPAYIEQQTDLGGCTRLGSLSVAAAYVRWTDFRQRHPARYRDDAREHAEDAFRALTSACACGDSTGVERELRQALRDLPAGEPRAAVAARLQDVLAGRAGIQAHCVGGR